MCEAAGFDTVLVETVGVGQSETEVDDMVDTFVLLVAPGGGDELQGIKRGVMELADLVVVTKADGELLPLAHHAAADYRNALHLLRNKDDAWDPEVVLCSALTSEGVADVVDCRAAHRKHWRRQARSRGGVPSRRARGCGARSTTRSWRGSATTRAWRRWCPPSSGA